MKFQATLVLIASYVVASLGSTPDDVKADLRVISTQTTSLNNGIKGFPISGIIGALTIQHDAGVLASSIDKGASDVNGAPKPFSEPDGNAIVSAVEGVEPIILDALSGISGKKVDFQKLLIPTSIVLQVLKNLNTSTSLFEVALISAAPADLVAKATSISATINAAFNSAIAVYSSF